MSRKSKEANNAYYRKYYSEHKDEIKRNQEKYEEKTPRVHISDSLREPRLKYLYKMTVECYETKLKSQNGHCALCAAVQGSEMRRMSVDHDHACCAGHRSCGKCLRGIVCANCNRKLGFLENLLTEALVTPFPQLIGTLEPWTNKALRYLREYACVKPGA